MESNEPRYQQQLIEAQATILRVREEALAAREYALSLLGPAARRVLYNGRLIQFVSRDTVAKLIDRTPDTVSELVKDGTLPEPFDPTAVRQHGVRNGPGRRIPAQLHHRSSPPPVRAAAAYSRACHSAHPTT